MADRLQSQKKNPLGLHLDFLFGKGYLWAKDEAISDWIKLKHLKMEIPDLAFPFDVQSGLSRFQHTRCFGREISFDISEIGLGDLLRQGLKEIDGFDDLQINFLDGAAHIAVRVKALGADTFLSFRAALVPPEPSRGDEVHLSLYDYRAYGPLPYPARILGFELISRLLQTHRLRPPGKGSAYRIGIAGDLLNLRPIKILLLHVFVQVGWKLPDLSSIRLREVRVSPGRLSIVSHSPDINTPEPELHEKFGISKESVKATAAYEAKDLFMDGDSALFENDVGVAFKRYIELRQHYGNNPELNERIFDCLLSMPTVANLAEAEAMCRELEQENPNNIRAKLVRATIASLRNSTSTPEVYATLSAILREKGELYDFVLSELARAHFLAKNDPEQAALVLSEVLSVAPRHRGVLEELRRLYERIGNTSELEGVLKRLTGVYSDRESLSETYLQLARHLINRRGELGEARIFLERVLRLEPTHLEALEILGDSYILSGEPLRALKAFSSASRAAENFSEFENASNMMFRVSKIWIEEVGDIDQALLAIRRTLALHKLDKQAPRSSAEALLFAAKLCKEREHFDEAIGYYLDASNLFENYNDAENRKLASESHFELGKIYYQRERLSPAADHLERAFSLDPFSLDILDLLSQILHELGLPDKMLALYQEASTYLGHSETAAEVHARMAILLEQMGLDQHAEKALRVTIGIRPDHREARVSLFNLLAKNGRHKELDEIANRYISQRNAANAKAEILLDWSRLKEDKNRIKKLVSAYDFSPSNPEIIEDILNVFEEEGAIEFRPILERIANTEAEVFSKRAQDLLKPKVNPKVKEAVSSIIKKSPDVDALLDDILSREEDRPIEKKKPSKASAKQSTKQPTKQPTKQSTKQLIKPPASVNKETQKPKTKLPGLAPLPASIPTSLSVKTSNKNKSKLEHFRKKLDETLRTRNEIPKPENLRSGSPLSKILGKETKIPGKETKIPGKEIPFVKNKSLEETTKPTIDVHALRNDPEKYVVYLEEKIKNEGDLKLLLTLNKEAGELYFFDLENNEKARPFLEYVRDQDPKKLGADDTLLAALESIYEESGDVDARIDILKNRYHRAESEEMREVYAILIAQLIWEEFEDFARAMEWVQPLLDKDSKHEAANRLAAELSFEAKKFRNAVKYFRNVLEVAPDGLDAIEVERKVADIFLLELNQPEDAKKHYTSVLKHAPGDARALDGVKQSQATIGDWIGYTHSLSHELGLLLGKIRGFELSHARSLDPKKIAVHVCVPASQIYGDLAKVMETQLFDLGAAFDLYRIAYELWPENVEALESRIRLARSLDDKDALSLALEQMADMLFETQSKFDALTEAARLCMEGDLERARVLFASAIAIAEAAKTPPKDLDSIRRLFEGMKKT